MVNDQPLNQNVKEQPKQSCSWNSSSKPSASLLASALAFYLNCNSSSNSSNSNGRADPIANGTSPNFEESAYIQQKEQSSKTSVKQSQNLPPAAQQPAAKSFGGTISKSTKSSDQSTQQATSMVSCFRFVV
jgi:hypothetical protein